ncbi:uncharacterized protein YgbK (DUF1537 family) [Lachnospiraceae bacterium PF1-22]|uniref:four-carbon acid sugar kinase family protein n=1 Tax=Ohessyouella blattaphilus TaxID=2949333 RepID=UPI003E1C581F
MTTNLIIADDFTGANDTGVQLRRRGYSTQVLFSAPTKIQVGTSYVIDTESRNIPGEEAYKKVSSLLNNFDLSFFDTIIKKVDSTLRGNLAAEIKAIDEIYHSELILFMPALPDLNRTTLNGIHRLNNQPITETEIANDPLKPVSEDNLVKILENTFTEDIVHLSLECIEQNQFDFAASRIYTADCTSNIHMLTVLKKAVNSKKRILFIGAAAIADLLFELERPSLPTLAVVGSVSAVTNEQILFAEKSGIEILKLDIAALIRKELTPVYYLDKACSILENNQDLIIASDASYERQALDYSHAAMREKGLDASQAGIFTRELLGNLCKDILQQKRVNGLFLTGGDTAISFFSSARASGSEIIGEVATGIPLMQLLGGPCNGLKVITKAGAFGNPDAISFCLRKLHE